MTTPHDPRRHPLQDDEIDLARVLRALPAGEPSSKVDAAILGAAADAVAATPAGARPRRRVRSAWALPTWAIGTAAAAVLAIGIGTQLLPPPASRGDAARPASAPASARTESEDRLDVELVEREREYTRTTPPPEMRKAAPPVPPAAPAAPAPPPPPAAPVVAAEAAPAPEPFPQARTDDTGAFAPPPESDAAMPADAAAGAAPSPVDRLRRSPAELNAAAAERRAQARRLEQLRAAREEASQDAAYESATAEAQAAATVAAPPAAADAAETAPVPQGPMQPAPAFPPVSSDAALAPDAWIDRIRDRWRGGDRDGALASLRLLRERHPDLAIPADLQSLR